MRECGEEERTLRFEGAFVKSAERRDTLLRIAGERAAFISQRERLEPPSKRKQPGGSLLQSMDRAGRAFRGLLGVRTDGDAVAHARRSLERTEGFYERALSQPGLDDRAILVLIAQHAMIDHERRELAYALFS